MLETQVSVIFKVGLIFSWKMYLSEVPLCLFRTLAFVVLGFPFVFPHFCVVMHFSPSSDNCVVHRAFLAPHTDKGARTHSQAFPLRCRNQIKLIH